MRTFTKTLIAGAISLATIQAHAEQQTDDKDIERIAVTGSQIKGVDLEGAQPLSVFSAEDIARSGASSISEFMMQVGQTRGGTGSFSTSESGALSTSTPAGMAAASLRGLGPSSTLTLVNGRRIAASSFAAGTQNFVDVNSIPLAAIERIEILATGASAIYGADAVAGVINYILKKDYQGAELGGFYGNSTASSDEGQKNLSFVMGTTVADGQLTLYADYYDRNAFSAQDRSYTRDPLLESSYSYLPKDTPNIYYWSARDGNEIGAPNCKTEFVTTEFGEQICAYYGNEDDLLQTELESATAGFYYNKEIGNVEWSTDFFYARTKSVSQSTPAPIDQIDDEEGPWANETALEIFDEATQDALFDAIYIDPYDTPAGQELWGFRYDARFGTPRTIEIETDAFRLVTGLSGEINNWDWETAVTLSKSESEQVAVAGVYNRYKYHAVSNGELCSDGSIASFDGSRLDCGSAELLGMYNPFLAGDAANDALLAMAQEMPTRDGDSTIYAWDAKISGELFEINEQPVSAAFGVEVRKEEITDIPAPSSRARPENDYLVDVYGFGSSLSEADRTQYGAFAEIYWPVNDQLEVTLAGRFDDYDDFGSTFNPKVGVTFRPIDSLVFRASWSTAFRAPSLTQAGVKLRTTTAGFDCGANQAVAALYCEGFGDERRENVLELGNANLQPEESESVSVGFAFSPTQDITLTVDYWSFDHEDLIDTDMTGVLAAAITDASLRHCGLVPEGRTGISYDPDLCLVTDEAGLTIEQDGANLDQILNEWVLFDDPRWAELPLYRDHIIQLQNTGEQNVSGIDVAYVQDIELASGRLSFDADWTHYLEFDRNKPGSDQIEELIGTWQYPENIASVRVGYELEDFYSSITALYTDSYADDIDGMRGRELDELDSLGVLDENGERDVDSWTTVNLNVGYDFEDVNINLAVNNIFDEEPPTAYGSRRGYDSINHNALGTHYRLSFTYFIK
ncbi:TonB-dependent receptor domain-containing protein [Thalassotalea maritima]|uniref:TonB-dependent receptor domain-containing protein n=1 Tax=Thalassotalea maritima TaxID=3242416 RepID=UPI0035281048